MLDLLDMSWQARSSDQNQAQLINMYLEQDMAKGKYEGQKNSKPVVVAYPMPGLTLFSNTGKSVIRALYELNGVSYCVASESFGTINSSGTFTALGTLNTNSGWCKIKAITGGSDTNNQVVIADGTNLYTYNVTTGLFSTPSNTTFVSSINMSNSGSNYVNPTINIIDPTGTGATAEATVASGVIPSIVVLTGGQNYTNPSVVITDTVGTGATAIAFTETSACPTTADDIENQDDYIIAKQPNSQEFLVSNVSDTTIWNPLMFASKYGQPDHIQGILSHEAVIWFFGNKTTEIWSDQGVTGATAFFPFSRLTTTFLHYGLAAKESIAVNGNYFIFLSANIGGGYSVFQTLPRIYYYNPAPISSFPIDSAIKSLSTVSDAIGSILNWNGHELYTLTFPTGNVSYVYDVPKAQQADQTKGAWYVRQSYVNGTYGRSLENCTCFCYGKQLIGDYNSGNVYYLDDTNYTENNVPMIRQLVTPPGPTYAGGKRVFFPRLQIDVETGIGSNMVFTLEKSTDNGGSWSTVGTYTVPSKGGRIYSDRLGSSRSGMIFRITTTMNGKFCILGFQAEILVGHS